MAVVVAPEVSPSTVAIRPALIGPSRNRVLRQIRSVWLMLMCAAAAVGLLAGLPRPPLGIAAAGGLFLMMAGAVLTHLRAGDRTAATAPALAVGLTAALTLTLRLATT
jgi:hypothetical protein